MKIGIIDDDLVFSNILKKQIENSNYFCENDIDIYNDDFQTIDIENYDFLFIDIILAQDDGISLAKKVNNKTTKIMKSEKAKSFIDNDAIQMNNGDRMIDASTAYTAVELAEQEAEERMQKKAISAFDDMWFENGEDGEFEPDYEYHRKNFIQKLNENEND